MFDLANLDETVGGMGTSQEVTGSSVKSLSEETRKEAPADWHRAAAGRPHIGEGNSREDIEEKVE